MNVGYKCRINSWLWLAWQGHEIYNLSEKELLYKQRISLELLEVIIDESESEIVNIAILLL